MNGVGATTTTIHLITVVYKSEAGLPAFLDSLQAQDMCNWRLYVIDNASPDASIDSIAARADPRIILHRNATNLGFAKAANQGLRVAAAEGGEFFLLINNDTAFGPDFLRRLLTVRAELGAEVIAPRIMRLENPELCWYAGGSLQDGWLFLNIHHHKHDPNAGPVAMRVDFASGCCLGIDRNVLGQVGLLDESFFVYWEDTDFCMRLKTLGIPILYVSEPSLLHAGAASTGGEFSPAYMQLYYRSYMQLLRKHFGWRRTLRITLRLLLREFGRPARNRQMRILAGALVLGLAARLVPQAHLD